MFATSVLNTSACQLDNQLVSPTGVVVRCMEGHNCACYAVSHLTTAANIWQAAHMLYESVNMLGLHFDPNTQTYNRTQMHKHTCVQGAIHRYAGVNVLGPQKQTWLDAL